MASPAYAAVPALPRAPLVRELRRSAGSIAVPKLSRRELGLVLGLSALFHVGVAAAALRGHEAEAHPKPLSRVRIAVERRPRAQPLPPPPPVTPSVTKPRVAKARAPEIKPEPSARPLVEPPVEAPVDTGSSLPSAPDGELFTGSGGLGTAAPPPPPPPPAPVKAAPPAPVIQAHEGANYLKNPRPAYPGLARRQGWEGTTLLRVQVSSAGRPGAIQVQRSSGRTALDDAAVEAVKRWSFVPATQGGNAVSGWVTVPIVFRLQ
jgi:protein TonB